MSSASSAALSSQTSSRNFARALHVVAATSLVGAVVITLGFQALLPEQMIWPAVAGLVPIALGLFLAGRFHTFAFSLFYLASGAVSVFAVAFVFYAEIAPFVVTSAVTVELPTVALVMVGGTGAGYLSGLRWTIAGFVTAELSASAARLDAGLPPAIDGVTAGAFAFVALILVLADFAQRRASRMRPQFISAAHEELISALRYRIEARAAALMHDTVLSHLAAIAATTSTSLSPEFISQMERDLDTLTAGEWLDDPPPSTSFDADWRSSPLGLAVRDAEALGLDVGVTGDTSAVTRLDPVGATELALAVKQCLMNVLQHSGTTGAELAIYGADDELLVMVVDTGAGFDAESRPADRLGIRNSIVSRIEQVGGSAQIWSTLGRGTSVVIRLPVARAPQPQSTCGGVSQ